MPEKGVLIYAKIQGNEPRYQFNGPLIGLGWMERLDQLIIQDLRKNNIEVYVDYFTYAKIVSYISSPKHEICMSSVFQDIVDYKKTKKYAPNMWVGTNQAQSIPYFIMPPNQKAIIWNDKLQYFQKHNFPKSDIYNVRSMIDDQKLKVAMINDEASIAVKYIYKNRANRTTLLPHYKYHVYEFVKSNSEQLILMLNGKRMDWFEFKDMDEYNLDRIGLDRKKFAILPISRYYNQLEINNYRANYLVCSSADKKRINKIIHHSDKIILKYRTNREFWTKVRDNFYKNYSLSLDPNDPWKYMSPIKHSLDLKDKIDKGLFDFN